MTTLRKQIEERIRDQVECFREVAGAANLREILEGRVSPPGAYVFQLRNQADKNTLSMAVSQRVVEQFAVVLVDRNVRDSRGADASDQVQVHCDAVSAALLGWQPDEHVDAFEYVGGQLVTIRENFIYWQEIYRTARYRRSV